MVAVTTGRSSMPKEFTMGSADSGSWMLSTARSTSDVASLTSVPKSNSANTSDIELDDVDWVPSSRGTLTRLRSMGSVTCAATSSAPAPGMGVMTMTKGSSISGMSSCFRFAHEKAPAMKMPMASRMTTLFCLSENSVRRIMRSSFGGQERRREPGSRAADAVRPGPPGAPASRAPRGTPRGARRGARTTTADGRLQAARCMRRSSSLIQLYSCG